MDGLMGFRFRMTTVASGIRLCKRKDEGRKWYVDVDVGFVGYVGSRILNK